MIQLHMIKLQWTDGDVFREPDWDPLYIFAFEVNHNVLPMLILSLSLYLHIFFQTSFYL